ncbi:MAG: c-type cytochrome [Thermoanaerobaculia bacterium]
MRFPMRIHHRVVPALLAGAALFAAGACGPSDPGERVWVRKCSACHGKAGRGDTRFAKGRPYADLTDDNWKHGGDFASIRRLIANGDPGSPMPPYEGRLSPEEIDAVSQHVLKLWARAHLSPGVERK